jgi:hypothetical protein
VQIRVWSDELPDFLRELEVSRDQEPGPLSVWDVFTSLLLCP